MPRRRTRKTDRKPPGQRRFRLRGLRRDAPDPAKLSRAFIALALARAEAEAQAQVEAAREAAGQGQDAGGADGETANEAG